MKRAARLAALLALMVMAPAHAITVHEQNGVRFASGGIGEGERMELAAMRADFNLHVLFAVKGGGHYLADAEFEIVDATGVRVMRTQSEGPWLFARLAPGTYTLNVSYGGVPQSRSVRIVAGRRTDAAFYWNDPAAFETRDMQFPGGRR